MVIMKPNANGPNTFSGQTAAYSHDSTYQERKIVRPGGENAPIMFATPLVRLVRTGVEQPGLQDYTSP